MGLENMRRWPMYIVFAVCLLLLMSLFNSWTSETELRNKMLEISAQLQECSKQQSTCMEESLTLLEQRDGYVIKLNELEKDKGRFNEQIADVKQKLLKQETLVNRTQTDASNCKTVLQSLQNLQLSKSAILETLHLEKETLTAELSDRKSKIEKLEKEVEKLKMALAVKTSVNPPAPSKITPAAPPAKQSPSLDIRSPGNEPVIENNAREEMEDINGINEETDFDGNVNL